MNAKTILLRRVLPAAIVVVAGASLAARKLRPVPVTVAPIERGTAIEAVYGTGTVEAEDRVDVKSRVPGAIAEVFVKVGARVKKGDLLARIDSPAAAFDLDRARADLGAANAHASHTSPLLARLASQRASIRADLASARVDLDRSEKLFLAGALTQVELDRARVREASLASALLSNEADERAARIDLSAGALQKQAIVRQLAAKLADAEVRAPLDGVVLARRVEPGEVVIVGQPLFKIGDTDKLLLEVSVDEADVGRVRAEASGERPSPAAASLHALPGETLLGRTIEVLPEANRDRKSFVVKVRLDAPPASLKSGMSAEVNIVVAERPGVLLAAPEAVDHGAVWVVRDGRTHRVPVEVGLRDLARVEVRGDLREGDRVVLGDRSKLGEGARVSAQDRPSPPASRDGAVKTAMR